MYSLTNDRIKAVFDGEARLIELMNHSGDGRNVIVAPARYAMMLVGKKGDNWELHGTSGAQNWQVHTAEDRLTYTTPTFVTRQSVEPISVTLDIRLSGDTLTFDAQIDNQSDVLITDLEYPVLGAIAKLGGEAPSLYAPFQCGQRVDKIGRWLRENDRDWPESRPSAYELSYAGEHCSMHWMAVGGGGETLYAACHDDLFHTAQMRAEASDATEDAFALVFSLSAFIRPKEKWTAPQHVAMLYAGTWHKGAKTYSSWASGWRKPVSRPQWAKELLGFFLVINKQQYGDEMWPYDTLPKLSEIGRAHGCELLSLFGWFHSGHDNQYPDNIASKTLGGADALKEGIRAAQASGSRVALYQQGHLIDISSPFYRQGRGHRYETRNRHGLAYLEHYSKAHKSGFLKHYTGKDFAIACPSCREWRDNMVKKAEYVSSFGADAVLYDQIGGLWSYPCFHEGHTHDQDRPSLAMTGGRRKLLSEIHEKTQGISPEYAFFSEHISDLYSGYLDFLHGMHATPSRTGAYAARDNGPEAVNEPSLFRYCFPDVRMTVRNSRPHLPRRLVNYAFAFGMAFELEVRYETDREDILADKWADEREYASRVNALRGRYIDTIVSGVFVDDLPLSGVGGGLIAKAYENGDTLGVALWNDSHDTCPLSLQAPGYRLVEFAALQGTQTSLPASIGADEIAVAIFEKE